jgi:hypothetical protein
LRERNAKFLFCFSIKQFLILCYSLHFHCFRFLGSCATDNISSFIKAFYSKKIFLKQY